MSTEFEKEMIEKAHELLIHPSAKEDFEIKLKDPSIVLDIVKNLLEVAPFIAEDVKTHETLLEQIRDECQRLMRVLWSHIIEEFWSGTSSEMDFNYSLFNKESIEFYNYMVDRYNHYAALEINELKFPKELCGIVSKYAKLQKIVQ